MQQHKHRVARDLVTINVVETASDLDGFYGFRDRNPRGLGVDTETTGLEMYSPGFRVRTVQLGNRHEAWVLPVELGGEIREAAVQTLRGHDLLVFHNAMFDLQVIDHCLGIPMEDTWPRVQDSMVLAKLIDPRAPEKGGAGNSLEDATRAYVDLDVADSIKPLMRNLAKKYKTTKARIFAEVGLFDPEYTLYAGMDAVLAARLHSILMPKVPVSARPLIEFEHEVSEICGYMQRGGFLLDVEYATGLSESLKATEDKYKEIAQGLGVDNVNSTDQVAQALLSMGVKLRDRTDTGKHKVDKSVLEPLVAQGNPLAVAVFEAKKAGKWRSTWVDKFLEARDCNDRCHPFINTMQARTGRFSITGIPAQTLPASDWMIRRCFIADPGESIVSVDYKAQELRVLSALSQDTTMKRAFVNGDDLHLITAQAAFGKHITKDCKERKYGKTGNFAKVFGGGAGTIAEQLGISVVEAKKITEGFDRAYPKIDTYSRVLQRQAAQRGYVQTASGRRLPVDRERPWSALNYMVQSTARDITCRGLVRLHKAGITPYLRLPIHDEVVASVPTDRADAAAARISDLMKETLKGVLIDTDADVYGGSWGAGYMTDQEKEMYDLQR